MADDKVVRIPFSGGLLESQETSMVPVKYLTDLVNWVPEPSGALRVRPGWERGSLNGLTGTQRCRGIGIFSRFTTPTVVQYSPPVQIISSLSSTQPVLTWPTPTQKGNLLLCVVSSIRSTATAATVTPATGWTTRVASAAAVSDNIILEYPNAPSQQGDQTPVTLSSSTTVGTICWLIEVAGLAASPFDKSSGATAATGTSVSPVTTATAQASEFVIAVDTGRRSTTTAFSLITATPGWAEILEVGQVAGSRYHDAAIYTGYRTSTGAQGLTVSSTTSVDHASVVLTYKGWYVGSPVPTAADLWLAAQDNGATYDIYSIPRNELTTGTWTLLDAGLGDSTDGMPVAFTLGLGAAYYTAPSFSGVRRYDGVAPITMSGSPVGARCIAIHKERLWAGGTTALPSRVFFSQIGDAQTWTGRGTGYWDFFRDDGEPVEEIVPFAGSLVVGKRTSLHVLSGDNTDTFQTDNLPIGGVAPGRSLMATPYGCVASGRDTVWLYDGASVIPISKAIGRSYGLTGAFLSSSYIDGTIYVACDARVFCFDIAAGTWRIEQVGRAAGEAARILYNLGPTQLMGPEGSDIGSLVNQRVFPEAARVKDYDSLGEVFQARIGDLSINGALATVGPRQLYFTLRQRGGTPASPGLIVTPYFDGEAMPDLDIGAQEPGVFRAKVDGWPRDGRFNTLGFEISQELDAGETSLFDIEDCWIEYKDHGRL